MSMRVVICLCLLFGVADQAHAASKLSAIFQFEMLNAQIAYLETITGPAMHVDTGSNGIQRRDYRVTGCRLIAYAKGSAVIGYSLVLTPKCSFNQSNFMGEKYSSTNGLTISKFVKAGFGSDMRVRSSCIYLCGNAADPTVDFVFEGPHALNFISIVLTIVLADAPSLDAAQRWENVMRAAESKDFIIDTKFNCTTKYDDAAIRAFSDVPVSRITVGYSPDTALYERRCKEKQ
jgi:hypothetical protein